MLVSGSLRFSAHQAGLSNSGQPLVICLHGFPDSPRSFRHQLPTLAQKGYRVLAPTLRGYEPSSQPVDDDYSLSTLAGDVIAWMDELDEEKVHLIGHDWGGAVAYTAGSIAPERFYSLTTIASPHSARFAAATRKVPSQLRKSWYMFFFQLYGVAEFALERHDWALIRKLWKDWSPDYDLSHEEWRQLRATFAKPGVKKAMLAYYRANASLSVALGWNTGQNTGEDLTRVPVPTLAIAGVDDGCIDLRMFDHSFPDADFPKGVRIERIQNAGHFAHLEKVEQVNRLLTTWLATN
ncbi:MAG: alpha/beta fold hydrolase [Polyangiales bacterium]